LQLSNGRGGYPSTPGTRAGVEPSSTATSRWFKPDIEDGEFYTIPTGCELSFDGTTWISEGQYVWPTSNAVYYVSSVNGDDLNDGLTLPTAFATIAKLNTVLVSGSNVFLERGSYWPEMLDSHLVDGPIAVRAIGTGAPPQLDCADVIPSDSWTPHATLTHVYQREWLVPLIDLASAMVLVCEGTTIDNAELLLDVTSLNAGNTETQVDTNAGSYFYNETAHILYIHPTGSTDPETNDLIYTATKRPQGIYCSPSSTGNLIDSVHTRRNGINNGSTTLASGCIVNNSVFDQGHKHNVLSGPRAVFDNCFFINVREGVSAGAGNMLIFYGADNSYCAPEIHNSVFIADTSGTSRTNITAYYAHGESGQELSVFTLNKSVISGFNDSGAPLTKKNYVTDTYVRDCGSLPAMATNDVAYTEHETILNRLLVRHTRGTTSRPNGNFWTIKNSALLWNATHMFCEIYGSCSINIDRVTMCDLYGGGRLSSGFGYITNLTINRSISVGKHAPGAYHAVKRPGGSYVGNYNIFYKDQFTPVMFSLDNIDTNNLPAWQVATGQDTYSVTLSAAQYAAFWLGNPTNGDFRINPAATCTWANGTVSQYFADGVTPLTYAGAQEHYDWATGQVVAGPPTEWPDAYIPLSRAQIMAHLEV